MKTNLIKFAAVATIMMASIVTLSANDLKITVKGIKGDTGNILAACMLESKIVSSAMEAVDNDQVVITLHNMPEGENMIYIFHDANSNYVMEMSEMGIPQEGCGMTRLTVSKGAENAATIDLRYF